MDKATDDGFVDHALRADQGVELGGVVGGHQGRLHSRQVLISHAGDAQALQLGQAGVAVHHVLHRVGQGLQFGYGVDRGRISGHAVAAGGIEHVAQQADLLRGVHAVHANSGVLRLGGVVAVVVGHAVGALHDGGVGVHDGLHFGGGAGLATIDQNAV